jgi:hypothetical protein
MVGKSPPWERENARPEKFRSPCSFFNIKNPAIAIVNHLSLTFINARGRNLETLREGKDRKKLELGNTGTLPVCYAMRQARFE